MSKHRKEVEDLESERSEEFPEDSADMEETEETETSSEEEKATKKKNFLIVLISLLSVLGLVVMGFGLYALTNGSDKTNSTQNENSVDQTDPTNADGNPEDKKKGKGVLQSIEEGLDKKAPDAVTFRGMEEAAIDKSKHGNAANSDPSSVNDSDSGEQKVFKDPKNPDNLWKTRDSSGKPVAYAPVPSTEYRNQKCSMSAKNEARPGKSSWSVPAINAAAPVVKGNLSQVPNAPLGVQSASSPDLNSKQGATVQAGHVNYTATASDPSAPWRLSPWGFLHRAKPCEHLYQTDSAGKTHEFVITDLYTVTQDSMSSNREIFRGTGPKAVYMITCSGPYQGNAGGNWVLGLYNYNLVLKAVPVS